jgi:hypothetical protein
MDTESLVEEMLQAAITVAHSSERILFAERAHERSIVFHIARHLADEVDRRLPGWSVDVEYDRWHPDDVTEADALKEVKKRMWLARSKAPADDRSDVVADGADYEDRDVYPDLIVHKRSGLSAEHDLLVVEVKKEETRGHQEDRAKLQGFLDHPFYYQFAVFLVLPRDGGMPQPEPIGRQRS